MATKQLGVPARIMTRAQLADLLKIKQRLGIPDPRHRLRKRRTGRI
jgi:hypothetical protein